MVHWMLFHTLRMLGHCLKDPGIFAGCIAFETGLNRGSGRSFTIPIPVWYPFGTFKKRRLFGTRRSFMRNAAAVQEQKRDMFQRKEHLLRSVSLPARLLKPWLQATNPSHHSKPPIKLCLALENANNLSNIYYGALQTVWLTFNIQPTYFNMATII